MLLKPGIYLNASMYVCFHLFSVSFIIEQIEYSVVIHPCSLFGTSIS